MNLNSIIYLLGIVFVTTFIIDHSGIVHSIKLLIHRVLNGKKVEYLPFTMKPFDCSLCMSFWITLAFGLFKFNFLWYEAIFYATIAAFASLYMNWLLTKMTKNV